jgi:hypothetical protein
LDAASGVNVKLRTTMVVKSVAHRQAPKLRQEGNNAWVLPKTR